MRQHWNVPKNEADFESLCRALFSAHWRTPDAQLHGRRGDRQHGVDFFGIDGKGKVYGGQAKLREPGRRLSVKEVRAEIKKAERFKPRLHAYVVATTVKRDGKLQRLAAQITKEHQKAGLFHVVIYFWDDICELLE
jgi:hypothetical protein